MLASAAVAQSLHCVSSWRRAGELHSPREMPVSPKLSVCPASPGAAFTRSFVSLMWAVNTRVSGVAERWHSSNLSVHHAQGVKGCWATFSSLRLPRLYERHPLSTHLEAAQAQGQVRAQCCPQHSLTSKSSVKFCTSLRCTTPSKRGGYSPGPERKKWVSNKWKRCHYFNTD